MSDDDLREQLRDQLHRMFCELMREQTDAAVDEAIAGDWERYDWLAGRIGRVLWGETTA